MENESLDLGNPGGQRWNQFHDAVGKGMSTEEAAEIFQRKLPFALRKAFKEFSGNGVPLCHFINTRHDPESLARFVRQCDGHEYAHLFAEIARTEQSSSDEQLICSFISAIVERISDQVLHSLVRRANGPTIQAANKYLQDVRVHLDLDIRRISKRLANEPNWLPKRRSRKRTEKADLTQQLLNMSLVGMFKK